MKIHLKFFATFRDRFKTAEQEIELETPKEVREIFFDLLKDRGLAERLLPSTRFAINCEYVPAETRVKDGDEVALIPPVSGG